MKTTRLLYLVLAVSGSIVNAEPGIAKKTIILTDAQMDVVTAGRLDLSVTALAYAVGPDTVADTDTHASVRERRNAEVGFGEGKAFACCGSDSHTVVLTQGSADGRFVFTRRRGFVHDTLQSSYTEGTIFILSTNDPKDLGGGNGL